MALIMTSYAELLTLSARMHTTITDLETSWTNHMALTNARLSNGPEKPFLIPSIRLAEALKYLNSEINDINQRIQAVERWYFFRTTNGNIIQYNLQDLVAGPAVQPLGTKNSMSMLKRTLSKVEVFLNDRSELLERIESYISTMLDTLRRAVEALQDTMNDIRFVAYARLYDAIWAEYLLDGNEEMIEMAMARIEGMWQRAGQGVLASSRGTFADMMKWVWAKLLRVALDMDEFTLKVPRQRLITEFFRPV